MSDEKPFAEYGTTDEDGDGYPVRMIGAATYYCGSQNGAYLDAFNINSAVAARERKAAAKALREVATQFGAKSRTAKWINARAAALEGGAL